MAGRPWTTHEIFRLRRLVQRQASTTDLEVEFPTRSRIAISHKVRECEMHKPLRPRPRKNWRAICNNHKPRIVLAQAVPAESTK